MPSRRLLDRQRDAAERLRREVMALDGSLEHPYFQPLEQSCQNYRSEIDLTEVVDQAAQRGVVFVGDYHALPSNPRFVAQLIELLEARGVRTRLAIEFVFSRQQRILDRRQATEFDDELFMRRIHYRDEWGYPWEGYCELLDCARRLEVPVHALDLSPRIGFQGLTRRDRHAAQKIAEISNEHPDHCLLVLYGESHVAAEHLPRRTVDAIANLRPEQSLLKPLTIFQNPDALYWKRVEERQPLDRPLRVDADTLAVFNASPLEKYEAYRQVLERWQSDLPQDDEIDLTPAVHHLIGVLADWIGLRPSRRTLHHRAGWSEPFVDAYPEVYAGPEASELLRPILVEQSRGASEIEEAERRLAGNGAYYDARSNTMFLARYLPGAAAAEAARFLRSALTGRLFSAERDFQSDAAQSAYAAAYSEALAFLGASLIDPAGVAFSRAARHPSGGALARSVAPESRGWLECQRRWERSSERSPDAELLEALRSSRPLRRELAHDLGQRLGRKLVEGVRQGRIDRAALRQLFTKKMRPRQVASDLRTLLRD